MNTRENFRFEVCANSVESCMMAQNGGADRVELCAGIPEGGTTPSYGEIKTARRLLTSTRLHVIIRPRGGDFLYTPLQLERMFADISMCKELGVDGVVFGCLTNDGEVDMGANRRLMQCAEGMSVTFHRAFDMCRNPQKALEDIISLGFDRILTSGQQPDALSGAPLLKQLNEQAAGRIILLAGCGVNENNIGRLRSLTGLNEFHFSARTKIRSNMEYINTQVYMGSKDADEASIDITSAARVSQTIKACLE